MTFFCLRRHHDSTVHAVTTVARRSRRTSTQAYSTLYEVNYGRLQSRAIAGTEPCTASRSRSRPYPVQQLLYSRVLEYILQKL